MKQFHGWRTQLPQERSKLSSALQLLVHLLESNFLSSLHCHHIISCRKLALIMSSLYMAVIARGFLEICGKLALIMSSLYTTVSTWFPLPPNNLLSVSTRGRPAKLFGLLTDRLGEGGHWLWSSRGDNSPIVFISLWSSEVL